MTLSVIDDQDKQKIIKTLISEGVLFYMGMDTLSMTDIIRDEMRRWSKQ